MTQASTEKPSIDLKGKRFGKLLALEFAGRNKWHKLMWRCICDCGNVTAVGRYYLLAGVTKSCGCSHGEKHGEADNSVEYYIWQSMRQRCCNPTSYGWKWYGARGIKICTRWLRFSNFLADMGRRPSPKMSIDRINNDGDYEPSNCRWASKKEQVDNRRPSNQWPAILERRERKA